MTSVSGGLVLSNTKISGSLLFMARFLNSYENRNGFEISSILGRAD